MIQDHYLLSIMIFLLLLAAAALTLFSPLKTWRKIAIVSLVSSSAFVSYRGLNEFYGKPKVIREASWEEITILGFYVAKDKEAVYLWIKTHSGEPLSMRVGYSENLVKKLSELRRAFRGLPFKGKLTTTKDPTQPYGQDTITEFHATLPILPPKTPPPQGSQQ